MTGHDLREYRASGVITDAQHEVLALRIRGFSHQQIALALDRSREAIRDRERAGIRRIRLHRQTRKDAA